MEMLLIVSFGMILLLGVIIVLLNMDAAHGHGGGHGHQEQDVLEEILEALDPEKMTEKVTLPHRKVKNAWKIEEVQIKEHDKFNEHIRKYMQHHWKEFYKGQIDDDQAFGQAYAILEHKFQKEGGYKHAYNLAKQGRLDEVVGALAEHLEEESKNRYVAAHIAKVPPHDLDKQTEIVGKVMEKYKHLLPKGAKLKKPEYFAQDYSRMIQFYSNLQNQWMEQYGKKEEHGHDNGHGHGHGGGGHGH